jgi:hypothetical protein
MRRLFAGTLLRERRVDSAPGGGHHPPMSDEKPKPVDDLKEGLNLLFRAAKGAVERLPTDKLEDVAKDAAKEVGRAFESLGNEKEGGLNGLFRAAKGAVERLPADAKDAAKEVGRAFESIGNELEKAVGRATGTQPPSAPPQAPPPAEAKHEGSDEGAPNEPPKYDDAYAPEPPKGPRVG